jgi:hypothetical protein
MERDLRLSEEVESCIDNIKSDSDRGKSAGAVVGHVNYKTTTANVYAQSVEESVIAMLEEDERRIGLMEHVTGGDQ